MTRRTAEPESDALLRLKQQIIAAVTDDPDAVPDPLVFTAPDSPASATEVMGVLAMAEYVAVHEEVKP